MPEIGIIIQVRTGSRRLPKKSILPFYKGKSILELILIRLKPLRKDYQIIISTTTKKEDDLIVKIATNYNIEFYRGDEDDVLNRFIETATAYKLKSIIRVCADNPFLDVKSINRLLYLYKNIENLDYCSYKNHKGITVIKTHIGVFTEIVRLKALEKAYKLISNNIYKEHVTNYIYSNPNVFNIHLDKSPVEVFHREDLRFTVDDVQDFEYLSLIFDHYYKNQYDLKSLIKFVDSDPNSKKIMIKNIIKNSK